MFFLQKTLKIHLLIEWRKLIHDPCQSKRKLYEEKFFGPKKNMKKIYELKCE